MPWYIADNKPVLDTYNDTISNELGEPWQVVFKHPTEEKWAVEQNTNYPEHDLLPEQYIDTMPNILDEWRPPIDDSHGGGEESKD